MHLKNSIAPSLAQESMASDVDIPQGFIWFTVDQVMPHLRIQGCPILNKGLAVELYMSLAAQLSGVRIVIQACAGDAEDYRLVSVQASRHKDLIISCRSADSPGHEYLARMGQFGEYDPFQAAPQNEPVPSRGAQGGEV